MNQDELKEKISKDVFKMLEEGKLKPILGTHYKLEEAITAHKDVIEHRNGAWGRIIIDMEKVQFRRSFKEGLLLVIALRELFCQECIMRL